MKLDFNFQFKGLDGQIMTGEQNHAGKMLSVMLANQFKGNSLKLYDWALKIYNNKPLEIDQTDADVLLALIDNCEQLTVLAKVPVMEYIKGQINKEKNKAEKK